MNSNEEIKKIDIIVTLEDFLKAIRHFWFPMLAVIVIMSIGIYIHTRISYEPEYQSQATFSVNTEDSAVVGNGSSTATQVKESLPYILQSDVMKNMVMDEMGLNTFPAEISLESKETANFYTLKVTSDDSGMSYEILRSILRNCPRASVYVLGQIKLEVLDESGIAARPMNYLNKRMSLIKGALIGFFLCVIFAGIYVLTTHTIQREEDFKRYLSVACIAAVPQITFKKRRKKFDKHIHIYNDKVGYGFLESIRSIRTRVRRGAEKLGAQVILVTSSIPGEGKSTIASNLALSLAERGMSTVLVDLDLRNPSIGTVLGMETQSEIGIADVLKKRRTLDEAIQYIEEWNVSVLFGGEAQSDPVKTLNSGKIEEVIEALAERYDYVILDTPPAAMLSDASDIAQCADCAVYVVKQDYARIERIAEGMEALTFAKTPIIGAILNGLERPIGGYGYGGYRYARYESYGNYGVYGEAARNQDGSAPEYVEVQHTSEPKEK